MTSSNPILDELHAVREQLLAAAGGTLDALVDRLQANERRTDHPMYTARRTGRSTGSGNLAESVAENQSSSPDER